MSEPSWEQADPTFPYLDEPDAPAVITCSGGVTASPAGAGVPDGD